MKGGGVEEYVGGKKWMKMARLKKLGEEVREIKARGGAWGNVGNMAMEREWPERRGNGGRKGASEPTEVSHSI